MKKIRAQIERAAEQIEKRLRFVISAGLMSALMLLATFFFFDKIIIFIPLFILACYAVTYFSVLHGIEKIEWITLFTMPVLFTISLYLFFLLFPVRWLTRLPFMALYAFSVYAILLTSNIFNVGVEKSLQLYRAAFSVNYFYQTLVMFLVTNVIFSFRLSPILNGLLMFVVAFLLALQLLWSVRPKIYFDRVLVNYSFLIALVILELTLILSFIPLKISVIGLFITAMYYSLCGLFYHYVEQKLFTQTIREYLFVVSFVSIIVLLSLQW